MQEFTIISDPNCSLGGTAEFRVHRVGCGNITRHMRHPRFRHAGNSWIRLANTAKEAVAAEVAEFLGNDQDFTEDNFYICNCCKPERQ